MEYLVSSFLSLFLALRTVQRVCICPTHQGKEVPVQVWASNGPLKQDNKVIDNKPFRILATDHMCRSCDISLFQFLNQRKGVGDPAGWRSGNTVAVEMVASSPQ